MHAEATVIAVCSSKTKARCLCRQMMHSNWHTLISHGILTFARTYNTLNGVGYKQEPMSCSSMQVACNFQPFHIAALQFFFFFQYFVKHNTKSLNYKSVVYILHIKF